MIFKLAISPLKWASVIAIVSVAMAVNSQAAYLINQLGSGSVTRGQAGWMTGNTADNIALAGMSINRNAAGFGDTSINNPNVVEGVWLQYSFTTPTAGAPFDAQVTMGGVWSGWGSANNGNGTQGSSYSLYQYGPTTSNWGRGVRYQHAYPGTGVPPQTSFGGSFVYNDPNVTRNTTLNQPSAGDLLSVTVYLNAITNVLEYEFRNVTTGESFNYTYLNPNIPTTNPLSFTSLSMRSDSSGVSSFSYSYGTFGVVPEPGHSMLALLGVTLLLFRRKR